MDRFLGFEVIEEKYLKTRWLMMDGKIYVPSIWRFRQVVQAADAVRRGERLPRKLKKRLRKW